MHFGLSVLTLQPIFIGNQSNLRHLVRAPSQYHSLLLLLKIEEQVPLSFNYHVLITTIKNKDQTIMLTNRCFLFFSSNNNRNNIQYWQGWKYKCSLNFSKKKDGDINLKL